jgi:alpha-glucuronidase
VCREPISPLLAGGLKKTHFLMEVQAAQEYTGVFEEAINV